MRRLIILILSATCSAQVQGGLPNLSQSLVQSIIGGTPGQITLSDGVTAGQLLVGCTDSYSSSTKTFTDSDGNTWSNVASLSLAGNEFLQLSKAVAAHTVSSLTVSATDINNLAVVNNLSGTVDVSGTSTSTIGAGSISNSITTTTDADGIISCSGIDTSSGLAHLSWIGSGNAQYAAQNGVNAAMSFTVARAHGSTTVTHLGVGGVSLSSVTGIISAAFKPSGTLAISTTKFPDGGNGVPYSAQLTETGAIAAVTWSVTSGTCFTLSINASTGVYSGTPNSTGTCNVTFQATDGTNTITKALTWTIGATLNTPSVRSTTSLGTIGIGSTAATVACGDSVIFWLHGADTHGTTGWIPPINGSGNFIHDSFGLTPQVITPIGGGTGNSGLYGVLFGPMAFSGLDTFTYSNSSSAATALTAYIEVVSGVQAEADLSAIAQNVDTNTSGTYTVSGSYTTVVPNQLMQVFGGSDQDGYISASADTLGMNSPFSVLATGGSGFDNTALASALISSPTTQTSTLSITHSGTQERAGIVQIALRPSIVTNCSPVGTEKIRRQVF